MVTNEKRVHFRKSIEADAEIAELKSADWRTIKMLDISKGGIGIMTAQELAADTLHHFRFQLPGREKKIQFVGRILHCMKHPYFDGYRTGVQVQDIEAPDLAAIEWFIERQMNALS